MNEVTRANDDPIAYYKRGAAALTSGQASDGRQALLRAVTIAPGDVALCTNSAELLLAGGFSADATSLFHRVLELAPEDARLHHKIGCVLLEYGLPTQAVPHLRTAQVRWSDNVEARLALSIALERSGALHEAADHAQAVAASAPASTDAHRHLARVLGELGNLTGCLRECQRVVELTSERDLEALSALGIAYSHAGQHDAAIATLRKVIDQVPLSAAAHADLGMAFIEADAAEEAVEAFVRAASVDPSSAQAQLGLGIAHHRLGRWNESVNALQRATQLAPGWAVAFYNLGLALGDSGQLDQARQALLRAAALAPGDKSIAETLEEVILLRTSGGSTGDGSSILGDMSSFALPDLLEFLRIGHKTGSLMVASRQGAGVVRLHQGELTSASSPATKRLGELLLERGLITIETFRGAIAEQSLASNGPGPHELFGSILVRKGLLAPRALKEVVFQQSLSALTELLAWNEGNFSFQALPLKEDEPPPAITFNLQHAILETIRINDERDRHSSSAD